MRVENIVLWCGNLSFFYLFITIQWLELDLWSVKSESLPSGTVVYISWSTTNFSQSYCMTHISSYSSKWMCTLNLYLIGFKQCGCSSTPYHACLSVRWNFDVRAPGDGNKRLTWRAQFSTIWLWGWTPQRQLCASAWSPSGSSGRHTQISIVFNAWDSVSSHTHAVSHELIQMCWLCIKKRVGGGVGSHFCLRNTHT